MIGAVVPAYNRQDNLKLLLASLEAQTMKDFCLVIADDGSTDGTREMVECRSAAASWDGRLRWVGCGPHQGVRTGRARNIGAANLDSRTDLLVMLDSDLILHPDAMAMFADAWRGHQSHVLLGTVEWLPPLDHRTIMDAVISAQFSRLRQLVPAGKPTRVEGTFVGTELRTSLNEASPNDALPLRPEWALPLNSGWPIELFRRIGGFDERMRGYGYQDMEFGARAARAGARCLRRPELLAMHVWHAKPPGSMIENQSNLDYFLRLHGPNPKFDKYVDWTLWWHYHAERGGTVFRYQHQLWAVNATRQHRLALPDQTWLSRLGHCEHMVDLCDLHEMIDHGTAAE